MASFADLRPIIIIVCIAGFFALFLGWVGAETPTFLTGVTVPDQPSHSLPASMIAYLNGSYQYITHTHEWTSTGTMNNASIPIKLYSYNSSRPYEGMFFFQVDSFNTVVLGPISYQNTFEHFMWYTDSTKTEKVSSAFKKDPPVLLAPYDSEGISIQTLNEIYLDNFDQEHLNFFIANSRTTSNVRFGFDNVTYALPGNAWLADALAVSFDAGYSEEKSTGNALNMILGLLTWNIPGVPSWLFALVDLALFSPAIYVVAIWILRILGSIFGGGASG